MKGSGPLTAAHGKRMTVGLCRRPTGRVACSREALEGTWTSAVVGPMSDQAAHGLVRHVGTGCSKSPEPQGFSRSGANRDRTDDLLLAKQALSQLSYGPVTVVLQPQR